MAPSGPGMFSERRGKSILRRKFEWLLVEAMSLVAWIALVIFRWTTGIRFVRVKETRWTKWR